MTLRSVLSEFLAYEAELQAMLDACRKKTKVEAPVCDRSNIPPGYWMDSKCRLQRISNVPFVWLLPSSQAENQAGVYGSHHGLGKSDNKTRGGPGPYPKLKQMADPQMALLIYKLALATYRCNQEKAKRNEAYFRCLGRKGSDKKSCESYWVQVDCPDVKYAQMALNAYRDSKADNR